MKIGKVYFVLCVEANAVKIGFTHGLVEKRLSSIQTGCPYELKLVAAIKGTRLLESQFHKRYANLNIGFEWFRFEGKLLNFVNKLGFRGVKKIDKRTPIFLSSVSKEIMAQKRGRKQGHTYVNRSKGAAILANLDSFLDGINRPAGT